MHLTFTDNNTVYSNEIYKKITDYECYDTYNYRYVFYIDSINQKYCCLYL